MVIYKIRKTVSCKAIPDASRQYMMTNVQGKMDSVTSIKTCSVNLNLVNIERDTINLFLLDYLDLTKTGTFTIIQQHV